MIDTFLTAYDPSDLPGTSIDPLGFERGYLFLADKILPGLTNVAARPRYFALLCAGVRLSGSPGDFTPRQLLQRRQETILRLERFWALANVLARPDRSGGVRGVTYAIEKADELARTGARRTTANYRLLSRQTQYGAVGMYASVADGMRFLNREDFTLTPALGEIAADAFLEETNIPNSIRRAVIEDGEVPLATLESWGALAHVDAEIEKTEARCLLDAVHSNSTRSAMVNLLARHPRKSDESELQRLERIKMLLDRNGQHPALREAITCILGFESCYRLVMLALERMLWLCRNHGAASVTLSELNKDEVLRKARELLPGAIDALLDVLTNGIEADFCNDLGRLADVKRFLEEVRITISDADLFASALINRHTDIQHGKFDRGRRKMPWLERDGSRINLTLTRAGGLNWEATLAENIKAHPYRLGAADAFISGARKAGAT